MHEVAIDLHEHRIRLTHHHPLQEDLEDQSGSGAVMQHEVELALGTDGREHVVREASARGRHHVSLSRWCLGRARLIVRTHSRLVVKNSVTTRARVCCLIAGKSSLDQCHTCSGVLLLGRVERHLYRDSQLPHHLAKQGQV